MKIIVGIDTHDPSYGANATLLDDNGNTVEDVEVEVRDYGSGNERDGDGNLYRTLA
jgi:hypothetical protein